MNRIAVSPKVLRWARERAGLDVAEAVYRQLVAAGVKAERISRIRACTFADETRFFSSRRAARDGHAGQFGGQCGVIALA